MGQKVHPTGFRIGIIYDWQSKWFAERDYHKFLREDILIRGYLEETMQDASVAKVEIERNANVVTVTIHTAKPGIVIGRGGQKVDELRSKLESLTGKRIRVNIQEIRMPELDAHLVARNIADQLERRIAFRRALRQTVSRTMARGAEGCKAMVAGRLGGAEMSRSETTMEGRVPLHTMRADIDYGMAEAHTTFGRIGVKVWIYKGEKLPEVREVPDVAPPAADKESPAPDAPAKDEAPKAEATPAAAADTQPAAVPAVPAVAAATTDAAPEAAAATADTAPEAAAAATTASPEAKSPAPSAEVKAKTPKAKAKSKDDAAATPPSAEVKTKTPKAKKATKTKSKDETPKAKATPDAAAAPAEDDTPPAASTDSAAAADAASRDADAAATDTSPEADAAATDTSPDADAAATNDDNKS